MNSINLMGRLTAEPELKATRSGTSVTSFTIAVERGCGDKKTDFIPCVAWRQTAEFITRYFHKGNRIAVTGALHTRPYTDRVGNDRIAYEVTVEDAYFCERKAASASAAVDEETTVESAGPIMQHVEAFMEVVVDEELPI